MDILHCGAPQDIAHYTTEALRKHFLIERVFAQDRVAFTYCYEDRIIVGGCQPGTEALVIGDGAAIGTPFLLSAREMGVANVGQDGEVCVDGQRFRLENRDVLYIGRGARQISLRSLDPAAPARFYLNSTPAAICFPHRLIKQHEARRQTIGDAGRCNVRTIATYIHPEVAPSCLLMLGITQVAPASVWNTMPPHLHERRMEAYLYFDMAPQDRVVHLMGRPEQTRHLMAAADDVVISPSWSIHMGVGTGPYSFIWGMTGENQEYTDVTPAPLENLR